MESAAKAMFVAFMFGAIAPAQLMFWQWIAVDGPAWIQLAWVNFDGLPAVNVIAAVCAVGSIIADMVLSAWITGDRCR